MVLRNTITQIIIQNHKSQKKIYANIVENVKKVVIHAKNNWRRKQSISVDVCWNNRINMTMRIGVAKTDGSMATK